VPDAPTDPPRTGPVLGVFAHPDDAEIAAGGILAMWAAAGRSVHLLVLTNGDRGSQDPAASRQELAATRRAETEAAAEVFENRYYNHSDHRTAGWIALDSCFPGSGNPHFFREHLGEGLQTQDVDDVWLGWTNEANRVEPIEAANWRKKIDALAAHASQITEGIAYWDESLGTEGRKSGERIGAEFAEEFRVLDLS
jgi:LmbE family N-acetylglucosaminyl deacetylase